MELARTATVGAANDGASVADYIALLKPRVMSLVVFTGIAGMTLAPGALHPVIALCAVLCIAVGAGASGAINMWYDRDIDLVMRRTRGRPLPAGRMDPDNALAFGVVLAVGAVMLMGLAVNWAAAALLAGAIAFYVFVYTIWLKRRTSQNIVIGGAAGAFPPAIGWVAVTGEPGIEALALFAMIFMWTPPHFWALALYKSDEYARAGVPMLPVVAGAAATRRRILLYAVLLVPVTLAPALIGFASWAYGAAAAALGVLFVVGAVATLRGGEREARRLFAFSIFYLFLLFAFLMADGALAWRG